MRPNDKSFQADAPASFQLVKHYPIDSLRQVVNEFGCGGEELRGKHVSLLLDQPGAGFGVVVHQQVPEFMGGIKPATGLVLLAGV